MALVKCSECGQDISDKALVCPHCGVPVRDAAEAEEKSETVFSFNYEGKNKARIVAGIILQIIGAVIWFAFNSEYIDLGTRFGGDFNTYTYQAVAYIAFALRWGLSGILIGMGTLLELVVSPEVKATTVTKKSK